MASVLDNPIVDQNMPWYVSYQRSGGSGASWAQHGQPALFQRFMSMVAASPTGPHLDIGCGNGVKTAHFARGGRPSVGMDIAFDGLRTASIRGVPSHLLQADCVRLPFQTGAFGSASDILCVTHIPRAQHGGYVQELQRIVRPGGRVLLVLFSLSDEHFHGHSVSREYAFRFDPGKPLMAGYAHYEGKVNVHFDRQAILETFGRAFSVEVLTEFPHPLYEHRKLWNAIIRKVPR